MKMKRICAGLFSILLAVLFSPAAMGAEIMPPADSPLLEAVKKGDVEEVKSILATSGGDEINEKGSYGYTPLSTAARNGNLEIVLLLAEHGAAIDGQKGDEARTPLMEAASYGHTEVVKYLILKGADVNARRKGLTPLLTACDHFSVQFGPVGDKKKSAYVLLDNGADVNVHDESWVNSGMTPLMFATSQGDAALVQALLAKGAKPELINNSGDTAWTLAKKEGLEYIAQLLEASANAPDGSAQQAKASPEPLIDAIKQGRLDKVTALMSKGADVNARTKSGSTPLMYAADGNRLSIARYLIGKGADVNAKNGTNDTALILASVKGYAKIAHVLLKNNADAGIRNISGGDALIYAVRNKNTETVRLLLAGGAKADERYDDEKTALIKAVEQESFDIAKLLLAKGADPNAQDKDQKTALIYACEKGDLGMAKALVAKGARIEAESKYGDMALDTAISKKNAPLVRFLVEKGADFKATTALTSAVIAESVELVRLFRDKGADVNERGADGRTPLMYAADGEPNIVKYLIAQGADVNAKDNEGKTALMAAVNSFKDSRQQTVKLLLAKRADTNAADGKGETALIMAAKRGEAETVRALLAKKSSVAAVDKQGKTAWAHAFEGGYAAVTALLEEKGSAKAYDGVTWEGNSSGQKEEFVKVVGTKEEWAGLWKRAFGKPAPDVDFERHAVACVFLGHSASWLYDIEMGTPLMRGGSLVIPYGLIDVMLKLSGPFRAGGQYRMTVFEKRQGLEMILEDTTDRRKPGI